MNKSYIILIFLSFLISCTNLDEAEVTTTYEDEYVVFPNADKESVKWMKKYLITLFKSIAIGSEFGDKSPVSKKWQSPMKVYIGGDPDDVLLKELDIIIDEINGYATDGFGISVVSDSLDSNFYIFFGTGSDYAKRYSYLGQLIKENKGLFTIFHDKNFRIYQGHMYVDTERSVIQEQRHILREELTQSLGLANDIPYASNSIFYKDPSRVTEYSEIDIEVIRLLYHPSMIPGLGEEVVQSLLETLLGVN